MTEKPLPNHAAEIAVRMFIFHHKRSAQVTGVTWAAEMRDAHAWGQWIGWTGGGAPGGIRSWVRALISDVHSPMDAWPRHALWDVVY